MKLKVKNAFTSVSNKENLISLLKTLKNSISKLSAQGARTSIKIRI